jgi:hypothetical protein
MPRIICWQTECRYNVDGRCRAQEIEYDPADGCLTVELREDAEEADDEERW